ncbi:MAG: hypothetical protein HC822_24565 [Oscillochloris sp.]|nr:hypothetical protein [Oscillochloris sp.]
MNRFDMRFFAIILVVTLVSAASAFYTFALTDGVRNDTTVRPLVWTIFAVPFLLFLGWWFLRRSEVWLAAFCCLGLYFFTPFVAARIETIIDPAQAVIIGGRHDIYYITVVILHSAVAAGLAFWRARSAPVAPVALAEAGSRSQS